MLETELKGQQIVSAAIESALSKRTAALMPYFTLGYPDRATSLDIVQAIAAESDLLELGIPFSDPLADGPTVQHSTQVSLNNGTTAADCLRMVRELRARGVRTPFLMFGYFNPILAYGPEKFVTDALQAGAQGFIIPDLPPEEAHEMATLADQAGMVYTFLLAPTSSARRISLVTSMAKGFIYLVGVVGVTGARSRLEENLPAFTARVRAETDIPLSVGFGISSPEMAAKVSEFADGVIVGSALIDAVDRADGDKPAAAAAFVRAMARALDR